SSVAYSSGYLLYVRGGALVAHPFDAGTLRFSGDPFPVAENVALTGEEGPTGYAAFSVASDGVLAYRAGGPRTDAHASAFGSQEQPAYAYGWRDQLIWFDRHGKRLSTVGTQGQFDEPALSPDGKSVIVDAPGQPGKGNDIWILELSRAILSRVTFRSANDSSAQWSPDGSRVVFASNASNPLGFHDLYLKSLAGGSEEELL